MPSYRQLRDEHRVALNTAQAAIRMLARDGLVEIRPAKGAFVLQDSAAGQRPALGSELAHVQAMLRRSRQELTAAEKALTHLLARLQSEETVR